jgi:uncharacterized protein (DUF2235 family)
MEERWHQGKMFTRLMSQKVEGQVSIPVAFLGIWDAVNATGVLRRRVWPYTAGLPNVLDGRHALSLDEVRRPYRPHPIKTTHIQEVWFAGVHSDVGGGYTDQPALSDISLKWMTVAAMSAGLRIRPEGYPRLWEISSGHATAEVHRAGRFWALLSYRRRPCPVALLCMPASATAFEQFRHTAT